MSSDFRFIEDGRPELEDGRKELEGEMCLRFPNYMMRISIMGEESVVYAFIQV